MKSFSIFICTFPFSFFYPDPPKSRALLLKCFSYMHATLIKKGHFHFFYWQIKLLAFSCNSIIDNTETEAIQNTTIPMITERFSVSPTAFALCVSAGIRGEEDNGHRPGFRPAERDRLHHHLRSESHNQFDIHSTDGGGGGDRSLLIIIPTDNRQVPSNPVSR